jgi:hypothetical protein
MILEDDVVEARRCEERLLKRGLSFETLDDLETYARAAGWPGWDRIAVSYMGGAAQASDGNQGDSIVS